jgi:hypothetical protein
MKDPKTAFSDNPTHSPFQRAFNHDMMIYDWYELPEQDYRLRRFATGMSGIANLRGERVFAGT